MSRFFLRFVVVGLVGFTVVYLPAVREHLIGPFTAGIASLSGGLIRLFGGTAWVSANTLSIPGFAVQILDMCNGVEATLVLWTAVLAYPAPWHYRLKGLLIGTLTVHGLNVLRIVSLVYLGRYDEGLFQWVHSYLWDVLIMLDILVVFLLWLRWMPARGSDAPALAG